MKQRLLTLILAIAALAGVAQMSNVAVKTNLLYDATASPNLGVEWGFAPKWSADISGNFNDWAIKDHLWKHWFVQPEIRYWFCERFSGHFLAALATAFKACFDVTGTGADATVAEKADADFEANGFQRYVANAAGDFLCYYFYFNKHNEDNMPQYVSNMEFANVRNNIYKLYIEKVGRIGTFKPTDVDDWDTYFTISVTVRDWLVRVNGIKF